MTEQVMKINMNEFMTKIRNTKPGDNDIVQVIFKHRDGSETSRSTGDNSEFKVEVVRQPSEEIKTWTDKRWISEVVEIDCPFCGERHTATSHREAPTEKLEEIDKEWFDEVYHRYFKRPEKNV